jgi:hypothetical protein
VFLVLDVLYKRINCGWWQSRFPPAPPPCGKPTHCHRQLHISSTSFPSTPCAPSPAAKIHTASRKRNVEDMLRIHATDCREK